MSTVVPAAVTANSATPTCPSWCQSLHLDLETEDHIRLIDAVHREAHLQSVAVELEQAAETPDPLIVLSLFTKQQRPKGMSAGLTIEQARHAHTALGEALRLVGRG
jgi:hypothetical protein